MLENRCPCLTTEPTVPTGDTSPTASIDLPSPKGTNGPRPDMVVLPFPLEELRKDDPVPPGSIIDLKEEYPYNEPKDMRTLATAQSPMRGSDVLPEKPCMEIGELFTLIFPHGAPMVPLIIRKHGHFPYSPPTVNMAPGTPTTISCAADTNCTLDKLATLGIPRLIVVRESLWVINTLHD